MKAPPSILGQPRRACPLDQSRVYPIAHPRAIDNAALRSQVGQGQGNKDLSHLFNQLGGGGGHHVLLPLHKAPKGGKRAYQNQAGRNGNVSGRRKGFTHPRRKELVPRQHQYRADKAQGRQHPQGNAEHAPSIPWIIPGKTMGYHA